MNRRAAVLLQRIEPEIRPDAPLGSLSPGHRQIVQIAASLDDGSNGSSAGHSSKPRVIVFDEPTSSLSIAETDRLLEIIRQLARQGLTIIYVSHRMSEIFACCDRVTVLRDGKFVATTAIKDLDEASLVEQMIGRRIMTPPRRAESRGQSAGSAPAASPVLEVRGLSSPGKLDNISLSIRPGEVLGVGGLVGAGRSELLDAIFGLDDHATGSVRVNGREIPGGQPRAAMAAGVGYVPEDRKLQGLFFQLGIDENVLVNVMPALAHAGMRDLSAERRWSSARLKDFQVKAASPKVPPGALSGGNQQKLLIARWMTPEVRVLLLDEPTRGIDVGTKAEIYRIIRAAVDRSQAPLAVLLVSSEMPELLALSDRLIVLADGRLAGSLEDDAMTQSNILRLATQEH
jgi:ABC-type sugar transport system ATPase subunit